MQTNKILPFVLLFLLVTLTNGGTDFELLPRGARSLSMGGIGSTLYSNALSPFHNPAALFYTKEPVASIEYTPLWNLGDDIGSGGCAIPITEGIVLAANFSRAEVNHLPFYGELEGNSYGDRLSDPSLRSTGEANGLFQDAQDLLILSMARFLRFRTQSDAATKLSLPMTLSAGASIKFERQTVSNETGPDIPNYTGMATDLDAGFLLEIELDRELSTNKPTRFFRSALLWKNLLASSLSFNSDRNYHDKGERVRNIGLSATQLFEPWHLEITAGVDFIKPENSSGLERAGLECVYNNRFALRTGYLEGEPTFGIGFIYGTWQVDWAYRHHELTSQPYQITVAYRLKR